MRGHLAVLAALCAALTLAGPASALDVGVTEDLGNTNPHSVYPTLQDLGMTTNVMTMRWDPLNPLALPANFADIKAAADVAAAHGVSIILATYQTVNTGITDTPNAPAVFAAWLRQVAQNCPLCARKVIVLNEPNLQFFFKPTWDSADPRTCKPVAPASYAAVLAAAYDALKAVDSSIRVYGLGLSPSGNDKCEGTSRLSMSPVRFLKALGDAYKAMGRRAPLMDALSFHPYPNQQAPNQQAPEAGYAWPNIGLPNMDRLKQAFFDAFVGTGQPLIGTGPNQVQIALDELGWQVPTPGPGYTGVESSRVLVQEDQQAAYYAKAIEMMACDPSVETLNFFLLRDEANRDRWQSGMLRLDGSKRPSYDAIKQAIARNRTCQGRPVSWSPARTVVGGAAIFAGKKSFPKRQSGFGFQLTAQEEATYVAELVATGPAPAKGNDKNKGKKGKKLSGAGSRVGVVSGVVPAYYKPRVKFPGKLAPGTYVFKVTLTATMNASRKTTFTSPPFTVK